MAFFCKNAQEEALKEIARQMKLTNAFEVVRELRKHDGITEAEYISILKDICKKC